MRYGRDNPLDRLIHEEERLGSHIKTRQEYDTTRQKEKEIFNEQVVGPWEDDKPSMDSFFVKERSGMSEAEIGEARRQNEKIRQDKKTVLERREEFSKKTEACKVLEKMILELIAFHGALGGSCEVIPSSDYDDLENHMDCIVLIRYQTRDGKEKQFTLGIDMTTSHLIKDLEDKIFTTADNLEVGEMPHADYVDFKNLPGAPKGRVEMPKVVMGAPADKIWNRTESSEQMFSRYLDFLGNKKEKKQMIEDDPQIREFINQAINQLVFYTERATRGYLAVNSYKSDKSLDALDAALRPLENMEIKEEIDSPNFQRFIKLLEENEETLRKIDPATAENIFKNLEALKYLQSVDKEKSSRGISLPRASTREEQTLELKEGRRRFRAFTSV